MSGIDHPLHDTRLSFSTHHITVGHPNGIADRHTIAPNGHGDQETCCDPTRRRAHCHAG